MEAQNKYHPDNELFKRFCTEDRITLDSIYKDYFPVITRLVKNNSGNSQDGEDVFQEGLIVLLNYCNAEDFSLTVSLKTFFYSVCRKIWLKKIEEKRKNKITFRDIWEYSDNTHDLDESKIKEAERLVLIWKNLASMPKKKRETLNLFYVEDKNLAEVAKIMGFSSPESAKVQKFKYLNELKKLIMKDPERD